MKGRGAAIADADLLIHECTFPEAFIEHRRKSHVGTFAHTSPSDLGRLAAQCGVKQLVATHIGHVDSTSPVLKRAAARHLPVDLMGPHQIDAFVRARYRGRWQSLRITVAGQVVAAIIPDPDRPMRRSLWIEGDHHDTETQP